jgi:hypothetical protein
MPYDWHAERDAGHALFRRITLAGLGFLIPTLAILRRADAQSIARAHVLANDTILDRAGAQSVQLRRPRR